MNNGNILVGFLLERGGELSKDEPTFVGGPSVPVDGIITRIRFATAMDRRRASAMLLQDLMVGMRTFVFGRRIAAEELERTRLNLECPVAFNVMVRLVGTGKEGDGAIAMYASLAPPKKRIARVCPVCRGTRVVMVVNRPTPCGFCVGGRIEDPGGHP